MDFPGFDIEADLAPLTALHAASSSSNANHPRQPSLSTFDFSPPHQHVTDSSSFPPPPILNGSSEHKVFFITNCGSLLGRTIAQVALDRGHYVAACAREKHLADLSSLSSDFPDTCALIECDVRQIWLCQSSIAEAEERFGKIDVVVNTASKSTAPQGARKPRYVEDGELMVAFVGAVEEISDWNFREQLEVNFFGTANIIRCVLPGMRRRRSGHIINITGLTGQIGTPSLSLLSAAHHAVEGYSEALAYEVLPFNVKVSIVEPPIDAIVLPNQMIFVPPLDAYKNTSSGRIRYLIDQITELSPISAEQTARLILKIVSVENPPLRIIVRQDSVDQVKDKLKTLSEELEEFAGASYSVDVNPPAPKPKTEERK